MVSVHLPELQFTYTEMSTVWKKTVGSPSLIWESLCSHLDSKNALQSRKRFRGSHTCSRERAGQVAAIPRVPGPLQPASWWPGKTVCSQQQAMPQFCAIWPTCCYSLHNSFPTMDTKLRNGSELPFVNLHHSQTCWPLMLSVFISVYLISIYLPETSKS